MNLQPVVRFADRNGGVDRSTTDAVPQKMDQTHFQNYTYSMDFVFRPDSKKLDKLKLLAEIPRCIPVFKRKYGVTTILLTPRQY
ncbi:hypothetical protein Mp_3g04090 [Marchantia polymorpha subsp. ruderalis]|uniref:Uncharacterized protein n=2 Tax=Marchantia polymorpha TaxID=3197 RepID=A0AAF6AX96_MARPO|nr:hypothetical protein MARPO_0022s0122 [Marchantia polymorpha]BBN04380.1 hypothetical protein Mp_3g04090 [Marchantia polymorpha subsp. ruderalis]|eukprot:PTQ44024.1 hypothetical protein MARPO_0022s0122 [Marchantia polymorpha]